MAALPRHGCLRIPASSFRSFQPLRMRARIAGLPERVDPRTSPCSDATPGPDDRHLPKERRLERDPVEPRHVQVGVPPREASDGVRVDLHGPSVAHKPIPRQ